MSEITDDVRKSSFAGPFPPAPPPPGRMYSHGLDDHEGCPQEEYGCWGPWFLDSGDPLGCLYEEESATYMRICLWWPGADQERPGREPKTMNAPLVSLAFLVHVRWAGRRFTAGLLNAYSSIYGLTDYEPTLVKMQYSKTAFRRMVKDAIDSPVNYRHVRSLSDVERAHRARATLDHERAERSAR